MKKGDKVKYTDNLGVVSNGIIKSLHDSTLIAFVVYNCNDDWTNYQNYTGISTPITRLKLGWEMNLEEFSSKKDGIVLKHGKCKNSPDDIFMERIRIGDSLTWVAKKGYGNDWTIYIYWSEKSIGWILDNGEKLVNKEYIKKLFPCDDEVLKLYRF